MAKVLSTVEVNHGGQSLRVELLDNDTIGTVLSRAGAPLEGTPIKNGKPAVSTDPVKSGDRVTATPGAGRLG